MSYAEDQERLRSTDEMEDLSEVKPIDVNPRVYADTEELISPGFLQIHLNINDVPFALKSLNQHEFARVRAHERDLDRFWALFYAYGVFEVDCVNVLVDRPSCLPMLTGQFRKLPRKAKQVVVKYITALNRRAANATVLAEAYATEKRSRFRWQQLRGMDLTSPAVTGVDGTQAIGMNFAQLIWRALNHYEDLHSEAEIAHENALFVGACMAGKGVRPAVNQSNRRRADKRRDENDRKMRLLDYVFKGIPVEDRRLRADRMIVANSVEELLDQAMRQMRGEKDFHDLVVDAVEQKIADDRAKRQAEIQAAQAEAERVFEGRTLMVPTPAGSVAENQKRMIEILHPELYRQS